ncbi:hypothetical protein QN277_011323 [Acacia crassicarpa]|uniref:Transmembrane protein n=1 Tax=Acacia crassicarpa TaxID=499986 RepID=A0AAE1TC22_9FABA|nr:hypothetical protein QN277_011323 [Acacia crassicarpa]
MLGFTSLSQPSFSTPFFPASSQSPSCCSYFFPFSSSSSSISRKPLTLVVFAENNNGPNELKEEDKPELDEVSSNGEDKDNSSKDRRPFFFNFNLGTLLDPDPDNVLALCLTGLLTWASVQVLWQLLFISLSIVLAALKYSFIAALLVFILITLL